MYLLQMKVAMIYFISSVISHSFCLLTFYSLGNTVLILSCFAIVSVDKVFNCIISNPHISLLPFFLFL